MPKVKYEKVEYYLFEPPDKIRIITYYRRKKRPTLKQYAIRKFFGILAQKTKSLKGVTLHKEKKRLMPTSAYAVGKAIEGIKAEDLITPELIKEYEKKFKVKVKKI